MWYWTYLALKNWWLKRKTRDTLRQPSFPQRRNVLYWSVGVLGTQVHLIAWSLTFLIVEKLTKYLMGSVCSTSMIFPFVLLVFKFCLVSNICLICLFFSQATLPSSVSFLWDWCVLISCIIKNLKRCFRFHLVAAKPHCEDLLKDRMM